MIRILCADILSADACICEALFEKASPERKYRAERYRCQQDKLRCVTADALLKTALKTDPFQIEKGRFGKPYIKGREDFFYNLSHSGRYVVIAWGDREVGVDVQQHEENTNIQVIAERYFTSEEQAYVQGDLQRFYEIWTKKESYVKYTGQGLGRGLRSFSVMDPEPPIRYHYRMLQGGYSLSLCTTEDACLFEILDVKHLL